MKDLDNKQTLSFFLLDRIACPLFVGIVCAFFTGIVCPLVLASFGLSPLFGFPPGGNPETPQREQTSPPAPSVVTQSKTRNVGIGTSGAPRRAPVVYDAQPGTAKQIAVPDRLNESSYRQFNPSSEMVPVPKWTPQTARRLEPTYVRTIRFQ